MASVRVSTADGYLTLINLAASPAHGTASLPQDRTAVRLYRGEQVVTATGTDYVVAFTTAGGRIEPPRFTLRGTLGRAVSLGVKAIVTGAGHVTLTAPSHTLVTLTPEHGVPRPLVLLPGRPQTLTIAEVRPYPLADRALGAVTFPLEPLPDGMSDPAAAVDDNASTSWRPGATSPRMVADLGAVVQVGSVELDWTAGRVSPIVLEVSRDGRGYSDAATPATGRATRTPVDRQARFVAVRVPSWRPGDAELARFSVL